MVELNKTIEKAIAEVLDEMKQPFKGEFSTFIAQILKDQYNDDTIIERINAIKVGRDRK